MRSLPALIAFSTLVTAFTTGASCTSRRTRPQTVATDRPVVAASSSPSLRLYFLVDLDGYFEPCGCNSRPLGGIDRLAQFLETERPRAGQSLLLATGDLLFRDPTVDERMVFQETRKAESLVNMLDRIGLAAYAPGPSDFARGPAEYSRIVNQQRAAALVANTSGTQTHPFRGSILREVNGIKVGIIGVSDFRPSPDAQAPTGAPNTAEPLEAVRSAASELRQQGARVIVVLASVARRDAVAIARNVPSVNFVVVAREESNTPPPPERVGNAYLFSAMNQGKGLGIIDVFLRDDGAFVDLSESTAQAARTSLDRRIGELRTRIEAWGRDPAADANAVQQQRGRLSQLERERAASAGVPAVPSGGNYFRSQVVEIAPELTRRHDIEQSIATYFSSVNDHNREAYANLHAPPAARGQASYVGSEECRSCHEPAFAVWERTPHSRAYWTLETAHKNFNLSCVGCHVTGYRQPGGSEVVQNEGLRDVQCETCHGPGSQHIAARGPTQQRASIIRNPPSSFCASTCHTPEHSDHFNYEQYIPRIVGPGHGYPENAVGDAGGVALTMPVIAQGQNSDAGAH